MNIWLARTLAFVVVACMLVGCCREEQDWCCIREHNSECDLTYLSEETILPDRPLRLDDILQVAMERNLDLFLRERELMIQREIATRDLFKTLPSLVVDADLQRRNQPVIERSQNVVTGITSVGSIGREQTTKKFNTELAWSVLDFGLSYYRARQEYNRSLLVCLEHKRTRQNLILNIIREYWRGVIAREAVLGAELILEEEEERRNELRRQVENKVIDEIEGLRHIDRLLSVHVELQKFEREYHSAKTELANLMGILPSTPFELAIDVDEEVDIQLPEVPDLERCALLHRPELMSQDMEEHIVYDDVRAAMLELLPNATLFASYNYDGDRFIVHNDWLSTGIRVAYDLLNLPQHMTNVEAQRDRVMLVRESRLKLSLGVITQVHLSVLEYIDSYNQWEVSDDQNTVKQQLLDAALKRQEFGIIHGDLILDYRIDALFAKINEVRAYGQLQIALERINNAIGVPLFYNIYDIDPYFDDCDECGEPRYDCLAQEEDWELPFPTEGEMTVQEQAVAEVPPQKVRTISIVQPNTSPPKKSVARVERRSPVSQWELMAPATD